MDDSFLRRSGVTSSEHEFVGSISSFNGASLDVNISIRSTFSFKAKVDQSLSPTGTGLYFHIVFTDDTYTNVSVPNTTSDYTTFSYILRNPIKKISVTYSSGGNNVIYIKELQIRAGNDVLQFIPHFSAIDYNVRKLANELKDTILPTSISKKTDGTTFLLRKSPEISVSLNGYGKRVYAIKFLQGTSGEIFNEKGERLASISSLAQDVSFSLSYGYKLLYNPSTGVFYTQSSLATVDNDGILLLAITDYDHWYYVGPMSYYIDNALYYESSLASIRLRSIYEVIQSVRIGVSYAGEYSFSFNASSLARASSLPFLLSNKLLFVKCPGFRVSLQSTNLDGSGHDGITAIADVALFQCNYSYGALLFLMADGSSNFTESDITQLKSVLEISLVDIPTSSYIGDEIPVGKKKRNFSVKPFLTLEVANAHCQGCAIHNDLLFMYEDSDGNVPHSFWIFNMLNGEKVGEIVPPLDYHYNNILFSNEYPSGNNQFPYLYVDEWGSNRRIYVLEITENEGVFSMTLVQTISFNIDSSILGGGQLDFAVDFERGKLYTFAYDSSANSDSTSSETMVCEFNLPNVGNDVTLVTSDIVEDYVIPNIPTRQSLFYDDGLIYIISGYSSFMLNVFNIAERRVSTSVDFRGLLTGYEAEAAIMYNGHFLIVRAGTDEVTEVIF